MILHWDESAQRVIPAEALCHTHVRHWINGQETRTSSVFSLYITAILFNSLVSWRSCRSLQHILGIVFAAQLFPLIVSITVVIAQTIVGARRVVVVGQGFRAAHAVAVVARGCILLAHIVTIFTQAFALIVTAKGSLTPVHNSAGAGYAFPTAPLPVVLSRLSDVALAGHTSFWATFIVIGSTAAASSPNKRKESWANWESSQNLYFSDRNAAEYHIQPAYSMPL